MSDLDTVETDHMIEELKRRHVASLIVLVEEHKTRNDIHVYNVNYSGGVAHALGLSEYANHFLADAIKAGDSSD